ncbi:aspartate--tRNA ligase, partial [Patescibacteria group bacterium]|nr:aspartate--tRNA ligase [Patescibacteria group bacterium]
MIVKTKRTLVSETPKYINEEILVEGWINSRRDHGKLIFIDIRDRTGLLQVVFHPKVSEAAYEVANKFHPEDVIS